MPGPPNAHTAFRLRATGDGGDGPPSAADEVAARPGAVADLASVLADPAQVTLSWSAAMTGGKPVTYRIQRRPTTFLNDRLVGLARRRNHRHDDLDGRAIPASEPPTAIACGRRTTTGTGRGR